MRSVRCSTKKPAAERVDGVRDAALVRHDLLCAQRNFSREFGRDLERFVVCAGEDRLRAAEHGGHGFDRDANDVVVGLRRGQRGAAANHAEAEMQCLVVDDAVAIPQDLRPDAPPARNFAISSKKSMCT